MIDFKPSDLIEHLVKQSGGASLDVMKRGCIDELDKQERIFDSYKPTIVNDLIIYSIVYNILWGIIGYVGYINFYNLYLDKVNGYYYISQFLLIFLIIINYSIYNILKYKSNIIMDCEKCIKNVRGYLLTKTDLEFIKIYVDFDNLWQMIFFNGLLIPIPDMLYELWFRFHWVKIVRIKVRSFFS
jgi:hypothetical protein